MHASRTIRPRAPLRRELGACPLLDQIERPVVHSSLAAQQISCWHTEYDNDSDAEWGADEPEDGEELLSSDDQDSQDEREDGKRADGLEEDGFLIPETEDRPAAGVAPAAAAAADTKSMLAGGANANSKSRMNKARHVVLVPRIQGPFYDLHLLPQSHTVFTQDQLHLLQCRTVPLLDGPLDFTQRVKPCKLIAMPQSEEEVSRSAAEAAAAAVAAQLALPPQISQAERTAQKERRLAQKRLEAHQRMLADMHAANERRMLEYKFNSARVESRLASDRALLAATGGHEQMNLQEMSLDESMITTMTRIAMGQPSGWTRQEDGRIQNENGDDTQAEEESDAEADAVHAEQTQQQVFALPEFALSHPLAAQHSSTQLMGSLVDVRPCASSPRAGVIAIDDDELSDSSTPASSQQQQQPTSQPQLQAMQID